MYSLLATPPVNMHICTVYFLATLYFWYLSPNTVYFFVNKAGKETLQGVNVFFKWVLLRLPVRFVLYIWEDVRRGWLRIRCINGVKQEYEWWMFRESWGTTWKGEVCSHQARNDIGQHEEKHSSNSTNNDNNKQNKIQEQGGEKTNCVLLLCLTSIRHCYNLTVPLLPESSHC